MDVLTESPVRSIAAPAAAARAPLASGRYWVCLGTLGGAALVVWALLPWLGMVLQKHAVPLQQPLAYFDFAGLGPRYEKHPLTDTVEKPSEDMIASLGTEEFAHLFITDTRVGRGDVRRLAKVFVTYYTGKPDMVPHVPDECMLAAGYQPRGARTEKVRVRGVGAPEDLAPVRVVRFLAPPNQRGAAAGGAEVAVLYLFHANGDFAATRDGVRAKLSNPWERYAYYSKIEITFTDDARPPHAADATASLEAVGPLLEALLPQLFREHFDLSKFAPNATGGAHVSQRG